ncbi:MAG: ligase-associated DNA damage response DEXH box helicase [Flavobacteriaceae bacterium]|nr:ligase-associated DNA damage response DEXH box helicase [Candidatus Onthonaster equi]
MNNFADVFYHNQNWEPHSFQKQTWKSIKNGESGLLNAPTGYGKTFAIWFGILDYYYNQSLKEKSNRKGLHTLWITPLRALSKEIFLATNRVSEELDLDYRIELRTGDTSSAVRQKQVKNSPEALITTPESVHLLLATKNWRKFFENLEFIVVDEWHELIGSKRGVMIELAIQTLREINPNLKIWGISATIGNLDQAKEILIPHQVSTLIKSNIKKKIDVKTIFPEDVEKYPSAGHLGIKLIDKVVPIILEHNSTLLFTNTRSQAEIWYQKLIDVYPDFAGQIALHHGSLSDELRLWVEDALHQGILKAVVCTSSLDLGVDFRSVDCVIQIGSAKGIARFLQRAGRSGHRPDETSKIYFLPTHSLEIMEGSSIKFAIQNHFIEDRLPYIRSFDLLIQYMMTMAIGEGLDGKKLYQQILQTHAYNSVSEEEFAQCLALLTHGGKSLTAYDDFHKLIKDDEDDLYKPVSRKISMQHRLSIGAIVSNLMMKVKMVGGKYLGSVEESFISRLKDNEAFWFSGRPLEIQQIKYNEVIVRPSKKRKGTIPSWIGGRFGISQNYGDAIRHMFDEIDKTISKKYEELRFLEPLFDEQRLKSYLPKENELLVEYIHTKNGYHLLVYPYEGKLVHEGMAAILAYRISQIQPMTFSISSNDYGFELLSDQDFPIEDYLFELFEVKGLSEDITQGVNLDEMARRRFRDIASISGLIFNGYPGKSMKTKHLQANASLFFGVFQDYEPENLLFRQAFDEVYDFQLERGRMQQAFERIENHEIILRKPSKLTPFAFPIFAESFRERYSNEDWETRLKRLKDDLTNV